MRQTEHEIGISVVLPNYNGRHLLEKNLRLVECALNVAGLPYEMIVSDDCSTDDSVEYLKQSCPHVIVVSTMKNSGFSTACNKGIAATKYQYTCIVNTDVSFDSEYFKHSMAYFENPRLFALKGDIVNYRECVDDVLSVEKELLLYFKRGFLKYKPADRRSRFRHERLFVLLGCCFVCRTDILKQLGGYDERFSPFYWEDLDLALTALENGFELVYAPDCIVYHQISSTISSTTSDVKMSLMSRRNKFLVTWKHIDSPYRWGFHIIFVVASLSVRWIGLDWKYYVAFYRAINRFANK